MSSTWQRPDACNYPSQTVKSDAKRWKRVALVAFDAARSRNGCFTSNSVPFCCSYSSVRLGLWHVNWPTRIRKTRR